MITTVLFDLVDTLVEQTEESTSLRYETQVKAIHESLKDDGILVDWPLFQKEYIETRQRQMAESRETLQEYDMNRRVSEVLSIFGHRIPSSSAPIRKATDVYMDLWIGTLKMDQGVHALLKEFAEVYKLGVVTNFSHVAGANRTIDRFSLRALFQTIVISGEFGWKKPSPRIFESALSNLSSKPEETVFIGDDCEVDITGAKQVGMRTIFIQRKNAKCEKADLTIESIAELSSAIKWLQLNTRHRT